MTKLLDKLNNLGAKFHSELSQTEKQARKLQSSEQINNYYLEFEDKFVGKKSELNTVLKGLKDIVDTEEKKEIGMKGNELKTEIKSHIVTAKENSLQKFISKSLKDEKIDPSTPGKLPEDVTHQHIVSATIKKIEDIFLGLGFGVEYANEIDNAYNTFDSVNIPENHPARDNWDTLWLNDGNLAIPHTSAMQNRIIRDNDAPVRKIIIGKCFRNEATDATHEHTFYQLEGVYLAKQTNMAEMIGVLLEFLEQFFGRKFNYKFTPDYFPFVEPGGQLAIEWQSGKYLEVLGCGMIHPSVIREAGKSPDELSGFAWGTGIERLILLNQKISDIRMFYSGDYRFLEQFS